MLQRLYGETLIEEFGPKALKAVQCAMATGSWMTDEETARPMSNRTGRRGWCRRVVNRQTVRLKTVWNWAVSEELIPSHKANALDKVRGLEKREHGVRETYDVPPAPEQDLADVLTMCSPTLCALLSTLLLTGARPSELIGLRPSDLNQSGKVEAARDYWVQLGPVWAYQPERHKTEKSGLRRVILFGPKAQAVLKPLLEARPPDKPIFSPAESEAWRRQQQRKVRKTKVQPSQEDRRRPYARKRPGAQYTADSLHRALTAACLRVSLVRACEECRQAGRRPAAECDRLRRLEEYRAAKLVAGKKAGVVRLVPEPFCPSCEAKACREINPYQLRHSAATRVLEQFGAEIAKTILGHKTFNMLSVYALDSLRSAAKAMHEAG